MMIIIKWSNFIGTVIFNHIFLCIHNWEQAKVLDFKLKVSLNCASYWNAFAEFDDELMKCLWTVQQFI